MEIELVPSPQLNTLSYKRIKVKIADKDDDDIEYFAHFFYPKATEEANKHIAPIPDLIVKNFKN